MMYNVEFRGLYLMLPLLLMAIGGKAQLAETDPRHENHYKYVVPIVTDEVKVEISNVHTQMYFGQMKLRITNKTNDYIAIKSGDIVFEMNDTKYYPTDKVYMIAPRDYITRTIRVDGDNRFHVDSFLVKLDGFYKIPIDGKPLDVPQFVLPNTTNHFEMEGYECKVAGRIIKQTMITEVPLRCTYVGNQVGLVESSRISVKLEDGKEFPNVNTGSKIKNLTTTGSTDVLFPGESTKINAVFRVPSEVADMEWVNMNIHFNDAFAKTALIPIAVDEQEFILDQTKTTLKNK